jgi:hypothetical protein
MPCTLPMAGSSKNLQFIPYLGPPKPKQRLSEPNSVGRTSCGEHGFEDIDRILDVEATSETRLKNGCISGNALHGVEIIDLTGQPPFQPILSVIF